MPVRPGSPRPEPPPLPDVLFARDYPPRITADRVRDGTWRRLSRGAFLPAQIVDPTELALGRLVAAHQRAVVPHWFSHESAALLWGLPVPRLPTVSHLRQLTRPAANQDPAVVRHVGLVDPADRAAVSDVPVTGLALTAVDCLRTLPPLDGLVVVDAALRAGADPARVDVLLDRTSARMRLVAALADPGAESAAETAVRFHLLAAGLPAPQTQVRIDTDSGVYWADLGYPQWRLLIEYDGQTKYTDPGSFFRERERQDAIESQRWRVIRLTYKDLRNPPRLVRRVRTLLPPDISLIPRPHLST